MSWRVESLILDRHKIKSRLYRMNEFNDYYEMDLEFDDYIDLLSVEEKVKELYANGILSKAEITILDELSNGLSYREIKEKHNLPISIIKSTFILACNKIAFYLGGSFTDEGYLEEFTSKYNLTSEQAEKAMEYMRLRKRS